MTTRLNLFHCSANSATPRLRRGASRAAMMTFTLLLLAPIRPACADGLTGWLSQTLIRAREVYDRLTNVRGVDPPFHGQQLAV